MSREGNEAKWKLLGDKRSKEQRIQEARSHINTPKQRRDSALTLDAANKKTPQEQLEQLDWRLGKGVAAKKERAKITKKLGEVK